MSDAYLQAMDTLSHLPSLFGLKEALANLSDSIGFPVDQICFMLVQFSFIPIGWWYRTLTDVTVRHVVNLILGVLACYFVVGVGFVHVIIVSILVYAINMLIPNSASAASTRQTIGYTNFALCLGYLCCSHIYRQYTEYLCYRIDFTAPMMVVVLKLISFTWQRIDAIDMKHGLMKPDTPDIQWRKDMAIKEMPSLLEYFSWIFHYASVIAGPSVDFNEYQDFVTGALWKSVGLKELPSTVLPSLITFSYAFLVYPGVYMLSVFPIAGYITTPQFFLDYPSAVQRAIYLTLFVGFTRFKYYLAWYVAEAGAIAQGIGFRTVDQKTGKAIFDRCNNCRALSVELCITSRDLIGSWNIRVSMFLKRMVYQRVVLPNFLKGKMSQSSYANLVTKLTSAFWHGFYPGYYLFFFHAWMIQSFEDVIQKIILPYFTKPNPENPRRPIKIYPIAYIYDIISHCFAIGSLNFLGSPFVVLEFWPCISVLADSYFIYYILAFSAMIWGPKFYKKQPKTTDQTKKLETCDISKVADNATEKVVNTPKSAVKTTKSKKID